MLIGPLNLIECIIFFPFELNRFLKQNIVKEFIKIPDCIEHRSYQYVVELRVMKIPNSISLSLLLGLISFYLKSNILRNSYSYTSRTKKYTIN